MSTIIQWNCRGLLNNHAELCLLSQQYNPVAIFLQETHIADESKVSFKGYSLYNKLDHSHERASGGSSVFVRNDVMHSPVKLTTNLQAVAVKITLSFVFTLCSIYAPPNKCIDIKDLEHLFSQIQGPVMVLGDFNAHNPLWGSEYQTPKGKVIETFISQDELCLFNTIPKSLVSSKPRKPWFDDECKQVIKDRKKSREII